MPWYLPRLENHTVCDPWIQREFTAKEEDVDIGVNCGHCMQDCEYTDYNVETTEAKFRLVLPILYPICYRLFNQQ